MQALKREIWAVAGMMKNRKLDTVYMGGGTPTTLPPEYLDEVLTCIEEAFPCESLHEYTVEAGRPDSLTREKLEESAALYGKSPYGKHLRNVASGKYIY